MAKGFAGTIFLATDDCHASYEELRGRGVEFVEEPEERPYGIDSAFRDPSGNHIRLTQVREMAALSAANLTAWVAAPSSAKARRRSRLLRERLAVVRRRLQRAAQAQEVAGTHHLQGRAQAENRVVCGRGQAARGRSSAVPPARNVASASATCS